MLPVADLLPAMQRLRVAYAGHDPDHVDGDRSGLALKNGYALLNAGTRPRLMRMMGDRATASCGAVVAHHQAPLSAVLRELRLAEQRAKGEGGRNAFSLTIIKRSGGALQLTAKWGEPTRLLHELRRFLGADGVSRRAVYNSLDWLKDLPQDQPAMLASLLAYQFARQADQAACDAHDVPQLAARLAALTFDDKQRTPPRPGDKRLDWLANFMSAAEFLARETRSGD
jgi:CRISPR-associated protein Cmr2